MFELKYGLQFFADAGTYVNATTHMVNAYTGDRTQRTTAEDMSPMMKAFYDTELLENTRVKLIYAQFGKKQTIPKHHNGTIEWRKWNIFQRAAKLVEGVIPTGQKFGSTKLLGSIDQYGTYTAITDVLELQSYDDVIMGATEEMSASAAETNETLIRNKLLTGTNVLYCDNIDATGAKVGQTPESTAQMGASTSDGFSKFTPTMINKATTIMKKNKVPTINGKYYTVIHPSVAFDLRENPKWIEAHKYAAPEQIYNGEIGELHGMRFVENPDAPVLTMVGETSYKNKSNGATYASYCFGKDAFGILGMDGGALEMIVKPKEQIGGPLNQYSTIGYKLMQGVVILYQERMLRIMSVSEFSEDDESNY